MKHKKFLKSEKAKVKLKGTKLKAAQNATKTDFKVRKIVITEQLKNVQKLEVGERKKHNISDCLARLKNSSSPEVISNLREIILYQHEDFQKHLEEIIKTVANLSISIEKNVRRDSFKIMDTICSQTSEFILKPFFSILLTYLKCAMTHIKPSIQEDSLLMFDILLKNAPKLVASEKDKILPNYLDLVSRMRTDGNPERTLLLQLGNKITNIKWRKSVLERLIIYLKCINNENYDENNSTSRKIQEIVVNEKDEFICNPYHKSFSTIDIGLPSIGSSDGGVLNENHSTEQSSKYIHMIMPLMFETWMEMKPTNDTSNISLISQECAMILKIIMDIQIELFNMMEGKENLKQQFLKKYQDNFDKQILSRFPYTQNISSGNSKGIQESGGEKCVYQNISIAIMFLHFSIKNQQRFSKHRAKCFDYMEEAIAAWKNKDVEFNSLMKIFIRTFFTRESQKIFSSDAKRIFIAIVKKCNVDQTSYDPKLALVCEILESNQDFKQSDNDAFLSQMVQVLAEKEYVPVYLIKTITSLAKKRNEIVIKAIEKNAIGIVKNLQSKLKISGNLENSADFNSKLDIVNLLYWINSKEILLHISELLQHDDSLSLKIKQLISVNGCEC